MQQGILVTSPAGFEVSTNNATFSATVTVGSAGNILPATIYIRLAASTAANNYSGNIILSSPGASNLNVTMPNSTVSPAPLTVTATDAVKTYGQTLTAGPGSIAFTAMGLQNGETIGSVTSGYGPGSAGTDVAGTYGGCVTAANATGGTFNPDNYNINYVGAQIIVNPAPLSIIANDVTKAYGQTLTGTSGSAAFTSVGLQNGETIGSVTIAYGTGAAAVDGVGTYIDCVTVAAGTGGNFRGHNYTIIHVSANIIVEPAPLTITAGDVTKTYGQILTQYSGSTAFTVTGLQNGETISTVSIYYGTGGDASYPLQPCDQCVTAANPVGAFNPDDYLINYIPGNIYVTPAPLTITADNQLKLYGAPNPELTVTYSGFVNGEGPAQITAAPAIYTTATTNSPPGQYPIMVTSASDPNYIITYLPGELTITASYHIPNAFTPNNDGINDTWHIQFLDNYQNCAVSIFNRLGQRVYFSNGYGIPWDGTYNGQAMPTGTYYYVIDLKNIDKVLSGYVSLLR
ncbi:MBG domain-containing protein [Mucilaginibacter flavidus]|uniref:MBG domain-containing protein n=1 Tax=Mucilaginibacter flavidus TaxID=2949309 RepID=UPI0020934CAC|nr:MBG domain-containing protein [Mucilaginibacter flavidus]MCO5948042.1 gliding motility-associated C-terminal domain-containing protein [Mucilaginibacter flavidus]